MKAQYLGTSVLGPETARELPEFAYTLFFVYAIRTAGSQTNTTGYVTILPFL